MAGIVLAGLLASSERRLSDTWFGFAHIAPSGRTVLVTFDRAAIPPSGGRVPRRALADVLQKLDAAGAARILLAAGLAEPASAPDDNALERVLARLGPKAGIAATALPTPNQAGWRRAVVLDRFARHAARTGSDLGADRDGQIRSSGIADAELPYLTPSDAWLSGVQPPRTAPSEAFRIDFGIDLGRIPRLDAASVLRGEVLDLAGARVIVAGYAPAPGKRLRVPRYGELSRPEVTALAAETLALGRALRELPPGLSGLALVALAGLAAFWCVPRKARAAASLCGGFVLCALGAGAILQIFFGIIAPALGLAVAILVGCTAAQVAVHPAFRRLRNATATVVSGIDIELLRRIACQDPLTGLRNRRAFEEALRDAGAKGRPYALMLCDLDGFKQVNDTLGHRTGDALLREIAARLEIETRPNGIVARLGGDEFAIIVPEATREPAEDIAQRLVRSVAEPIVLGNRPVHVGVSIGIAIGSAQDDASALMESADAAMYCAKRGHAGYGFGPGPRTPAAPASAGERRDTAAPAATVMPPWPLPRANQERMAPAATS
jgi:diguanylate cyclase (GGDEF)-like protein